jgi:hypothetical protein
MLRVDKVLTNKVKNVKNSRNCTRFFSFCNLMLRFFHFRNAKDGAD